MWTALSRFPMTRLLPLFCCCSSAASRSLRPPVRLPAVLNNKVDVRGKKVVCVLSGGNIDVSFIHKIVEKGLITRCRQLKFSVLMPDAPGALEHFSHIVAQQNANIILFQHDRVQTDLEIGEAIIHVVCEVGGVDHAKRLIDTLTDDGYKVFTSQI